jgi:hypothetical protein
MESVKLMGEEITRKREEETRRETEQLCTSASRQAMPIHAEAVLIRKI